MAWLCVYDKHLGHLSLIQPCWKGHSCSSPPPPRLSLPSPPVSTSAPWPAFTSSASSLISSTEDAALSLSLSHMAARIKAALYPTKPMMMSACYWLSQVWMTEQRMGVGWNLSIAVRWPAKHKWAIVCVRVCLCVCAGVVCVGDGWDPAVLVSADIICPSCCTPLTVYNKLSLSPSLFTPPPHLPCCFPSLLVDLIWVHRHRDGHNG